MKWNEGKPPEYKTVLMWHYQDLFPVVAFRIVNPSGSDLYMLVKAGCEGGEHQTYPSAGPEYWTPTHWAEIPELPHKWHPVLSPAPGGRGDTGGLTEERRRWVSESKKPKWTPGPWEVPDPEDAGSVCTTVGGRGSVCLLFDNHYELPLPYEDQDEANANAHLIAAAPDLAEAAEAAMRYDDAIRSCADSPDRMASFCTATGEDLDYLYDDWISKSHAALIKARGDEG